MPSQILETFITALSSCPLPLSHVPSAHFSVSFSLFLSLRLFASSSVLPLSLCLSSTPSISLLLYFSWLSACSVEFSDSSICSSFPLPHPLSLSCASVVTYSHVALLCSSLGGQQSITIAGDITVEHGNDPGCLKNICCD